MPFCSRRNECSYPNARQCGEVIPVRAQIGLLARRDGSSHSHSRPFPQHLLVGCRCLSPSDMFHTEDGGGAVLAGRLEMTRGGRLGERIR